MPRQLQPCGTPAAYRRHLKHHEEPCEACRAANTAKKREQSGAEPQSLGKAIVQVMLGSGGDYVTKPEPPAERSAKADLEWAREQLIEAIRTTVADDPTKLPALVRELRETWKVLGADDAGGEGAAQDDDDDLTRARKAREAARAANA